MGSETVVETDGALPSAMAGRDPGACKRARKPSGLSVVVLASDLAVDVDEFGLHASSSPCSSTVSETSTEDYGNDDFLDLEELEFLRIEGVDKQGRQIVRVVGKFLPAPVVDCKRLKAFVLRKFGQELKDGSFCLVYFHSNVQRGDNSPGMFTLRSIYETLPCDYKQRLEVVYFVHPGLRSRVLLGTLGRFFLTERLYWKIQYVSRLEFLWDHLRKGQVDVPEHVREHDQELETRPLMDYGLETDPFQNADLSASGANMAFNRYSHYACRPPESHSCKFGSHTNKLRRELKEMERQGLLDLSEVELTDKKASTSTVSSPATVPVKLQERFHGSGGCPAPTSQSKSEQSQF